MRGCAGEFDLDFAVSTPRHSHIEQGECRLKEFGMLAISYWPRACEIETLAERRCYRDNVFCPGASEFLWYLSNTSFVAWFRTLFLEVIEFGFPYQDWIMVCRLITQEGEEMTANMTSKNDLLPNSEPSFHGWQIYARMHWSCLRSFTPRQCHKDQVECWLKSLGCSLGNFTHSKHSKAIGHSVCLVKATVSISAPSMNGFICGAYLGWVLKSMD